MYSIHIKIQQNPIFKQKPLKSGPSALKRRDPAHNLCVRTSFSADDNTDIWQSLSTNILILCNSHSQMALCDLRNRTCGPFPLCTVVSSLNTKQACGGTIPKRGPFTQSKMSKYK